MVTADHDDHQITSISKFFKSVKVEIILPEEMVALTDKPMSVETPQTTQMDLTEPTTPVQKDIAPIQRDTTEVGEAIITVNVICQKTGFSVKSNFHIIKSFTLQKKTKVRKSKGDNFI